jgi:hypothetical protein
LFAQVGGIGYFIQEQSLACIVVILKFGPNENCLFCLCYGCTNRSPILGQCPKFWTTHISLGN